MSKLRTQLSTQTARVKTLEKEKEKAADNIDGIYGSDTRANIMKLRQERDSYKAKLENCKNKTNEETYKLKVQLKKIQDDLKKTQDELQNSKTENTSLRKSLEEKPRKVGEVTLLGFFHGHTIAIQILSFSCGEILGNSL